MTLNELINKDTQTGKLVSFTEGHGKTGSVIVVTSELDKKKYVLEKSIKDYARFEKWPETQKKADIKPTGKFHRTKDYGKLPVIQIRLKDEEEQNVDDTNKEMVF